MNTTVTESPRTLSEDLLKVSEARHHDPFSVLGLHSDGALECVRAFLSHARWMRIGEDGIYIKDTASGHSGWFLPQVAPEQGWDAEETLSYCCSHKMG